MQEIIIKNNNTGLKVYINGVPDLKQIPKDKVENLIEYLELEVSNIIRK